MLCTLALLQVASSAATLAATANPLAPGGVPGVDAALVAAKAAKAVEIASKWVQWQWVWRRARQQQQLQIVPDTSRCSVSKVWYADAGGYNSSVVISLKVCAGSSTHNQLCITSISNSVALHRMLEHHLSSARHPNAASHNILQYNNITCIVNPACSAGSVCRPR